MQILFLDHFSQQFRLSSDCSAFSTPQITHSTNVHTTGHPCALRSGFVVIAAEAALMERSFRHQSQGSQEQ